MFTSAVISLQKYLVDSFFWPLKSLFIFPRLIHHRYHSDSCRYCCRRRLSETQSNMAYNILIKHDGNSIVILRIIDSHLDQDEDPVTTVKTVNIRSTNWKEELREKKQFVTWLKMLMRQKKQAETDDNFEIERPELKTRSSQATLSIL